MRAAFFIAVAAAAGCASSVAPDPGLEGLAITKVAPETVVPGSKLVVKGASFVDEQWGSATLRLVGKAGGQNVDLSWPAKFVDFSTMTVAIDADKIDALGGDIDFAGDVSIEVVATSDGETYKTDALKQSLSFRRKLTPAPTGVVDGVIFVNDEIEVDGDGFLLGGEEGSTFARVTGCFKLDTSSTCTTITQQDIPMQPREELSRQHAAFPFAPKIAGIKPGTFTGKVTILNKHAGGAEVMAQPINVDYTVVTSQVFSADPPAASLGQYVFVHGGGFVGGETGAGTELELSGTFNKTGMNPFPITMQLVPEFVEGRLVRYVLNTDDELGISLDLRKETGKFTGKITPIVTYAGTTVRGVSTNVAFEIAPVKQVVYLNFSPSYVEGLRDFGLRAVDKRVRDRILATLARIYKGVNIEFRIEPVTDYALFEEVTLMGVDPNNMGLFGYDNSPGKDNGNVRLYDKLGGVNAITQQDGYPGYGGVFLRSLMGFSKHPGSFAKAVPGADPVFDQIFDPFRADRDGTPVSAADLSSNLQPLTDGGACPSSDRSARIQCAIFVLGNLIGGTLGHEIGHSLGLANPYAEGFHDAGDAPARLMDSGGDRPFMERAELMGQTPAVFCDEEYSYLRDVLPSPEPANVITRPSCY
ncbi:MAG TPA: hypothetical protein VIV40_30025 [Kofleriaceae bacterium]